MKKFIFGLVLFFSGCVIFGQIIIALAIIDGLYQDIINAIWFSGLTVPFLFSIALMVYGVIMIRKEGIALRAGKKPSDIQTITRRILFPR
jgi:hypothetical protein